MQDISELMDGELNVDAAGRQISRLKADTVARETWDTYHLIGDAMRGRMAATGGFVTRFSERLASEPTVLAPRPAMSRSRLQTYVLSAVASVAAVGVVGWMAFNVMKPDPIDAPAGGQLAVAPVQAGSANVATLANVAASQTTPSAPIAVATPAEHVHEYLLAHQGISPTTAIQGVTPYIRTVSSSGE